MEAGPTLIVEAVDTTGKPVVDVNATEIAQEAPAFEELLQRADQHGTARTEVLSTIREAEEFVAGRDGRGLSAIAIRVGSQHYEFLMEVG